MVSAEIIILILHASKILKTPPLLMSFPDVYINSYIQSSNNNLNTETSKYLMEM